MQELKAFTSHVPFLRKFLEDVLWHNKEINKKDDLICVKQRASTGEQGENSQEDGEGKPQGPRRFSGPEGSQCPWSWSEASRGNFISM